MKCIVHYTNQSTYSTLKSLSETNIRRIEEAKIKRLEIGDAHIHEDQCNTIPETMNVDLHGIHLEPCYKRFTAILGNKKFQVDAHESRKSCRLSSPLSSRRLSSPLSSPIAWIYPKECHICSKFRVQYKNKKYGSFYVNQMLNLERNYPGMTQYMEKGGFSIQAQEHHDIRTSTDQRGEQTINKNAKSSGGVKGFAGNQMSVLKWCLNRPEQARHFNELMCIAGLDTSTENYKPLRDIEIQKSEKHVTSIISVIEEEYLNPFSLQLDKDKLYNLSSGIHKEDDVDELLAIWDKGKAIADEFTGERILSSHKELHHPLRRNKIPTFQPPKIKVSSGKVTKVIDANRNIISRLLSLTAKTQHPIDFEKAFTFPLYGVPLSLAHPDGLRRQTQKSKLIKVITQEIPTITDVPDDINKQRCALIVDMIAQIRVCTTNIPDTFEEFIMRFLRTIPTGYHRVDIVADTYRAHSIKGEERARRGTSKILIGSVKSKMPRDMNKFMMNNDNKNQLINLIFQFIIKNRSDVLQMLMTEEMLLFGDNVCHKVTTTTTIESDLKSNQEEADTKIVLHALNVLQLTNLFVALRSPSGDTDILVLILGLITEGKDRLYYDYGNGNNRKGTWLNALELEEDQRNALIGFHAFTGNDFVSSFFQKGKTACWNVMVKSEKFLTCFSELGQHWELTNDLIDTIEEYVCRLFGAKLESVDILRFQMFQRKYARENKSIDLSTLPPCHSSLLLHIKRANYVAAMWKRTQNSPTRNT